MSPPWALRGAAIKDGAALRKGYRLAVTEATKQGVAAHLQEARICRARVALSGPASSPNEPLQLTVVVRARRDHEFTRYLVLHVGSGTAKELVDVAV